MCAGGMLRSCEGRRCLLLTGSVSQVLVTPGYLCDLLGKGAVITESSPALCCEISVWPRSAPETELAPTLLFTQRANQTTKGKSSSGTSYTSFQQRHTCLPSIGRESSFRVLGGGVSSYHEYLTCVWPREAYAFSDVMLPPATCP